MKLDSSDKRLLEALQRDASLSQADLAEIAGMSRSSVWRRIRDFEEIGLIQRQVALVDPRQVGISLQVLLAVAMTEHTDENRHEFERFVAAVRSRNRADLGAEIEEGHISTALCHLGNIALRLRRSVEFDPDTETIPGDPAADAMLRGRYRRPYVVSEIG